jgi:hypothetical protein
MGNSLIVSSEPGEALFGGQEEAILSNGLRTLCINDVLVQVVVAEASAFATARRTAKRRIRCLSHM